MQIYVNGRKEFDGQTSLLLNPIFEVGAIHARALLEFIGLKVEAGRLVQLNLKTRKPDDAAIEKLTGPLGALSLVTVQQVAEMHPENRGAAAQSLVTIIVATHKGMAHSSATYFSKPAKATEFLLALELTQRLVETHVYRPLGRSRPPLPIEVCGIAKQPPPQQD